jgi:hypothetical protein
MIGKGLVLASLLVAMLVMSEGALALGEIGGVYTFNVMPGHESSGCLVSGSQNYCKGWGVAGGADFAFFGTITSNGEGAKYLSYPSKVLLPAGNQIVNINVTAAIPSDYVGNVTMNATLTLTQGCDPIAGGACISLAAMKKVTINVLNYTRPMPVTTTTVHTTSTTTTSKATTTVRSRGRWRW